MNEDHQQESAQWFVYMIRTHKSTLYTGISKDIARRFQEHLDMFNGEKNAKGAKFFRFNEPIEIVYSKAYSSRSDVSKEEVRIKKLSRREKLALIESA